MYPKRTPPELIEKLKQTVTVEEITEEEADPIYLRITRYNFYHSWSEKPDTLQIFRVLQDHKSKIYYDDAAQIGITDIVAIELSFAANAFTDLARDRCLRMLCRQ